MEICRKQRHFTNISPRQRTTVLVFTQNKQPLIYLSVIIISATISFMFSTDKKKDSLNYMSFANNHAKVSF